MPTFTEKDRDAICKAMRKACQRDARALSRKLAKETISHDRSKPGLMDAERKAVDKALAEMVGAKITDAGFIAGETEGGLAFDFEKQGQKRRLVLGYNELGEWIKCRVTR